MKDKIHPKYGPVIYRDTQTGEEWISASTKLDGKTEVRDGVEYHVIPLEISSASHPFYSGKKTFVDTAGRVDRFKKRAGGTMTSRKKLKEKLAAKGGGED